MGRAICLNGVSSFNLIWCFIFVAWSKWRSCWEKTSQNEFSFCTIRSRQSDDNGDCPKSNCNLGLEVLCCWLEELTAASFSSLMQGFGMSLCGMLSSAKIQLLGRRMSWSVSFLKETGTLKGLFLGKVMRQFSTNTPPGRTDSDGCSSKAQVSFPTNTDCTMYPSNKIFCPAGRTSFVLPFSFTRPSLPLTTCFCLLFSTLQTWL